MVWYHVCQELQLFRNNISIIIRLRAASTKQAPGISRGLVLFFFPHNLLVKTLIISFCGSEANDGVYDSCCIDGCETIYHWDNQGIFLTVIAAIQREKKE